MGQLSAQKGEDHSHRTTYVENPKKFVYISVFICRMANHAQGGSGVNCKEGLAHIGLR